MEGVRWEVGGYAQGVAVVEETTSDSHLDAREVVVAETWRDA